MVSGSEMSGRARGRRREGGRFARVRKGAVGPSRESFNKLASAQWTSATLDASVRIPHRLPDNERGGVLATIPNG